MLFENIGLRFREFGRRPATPERTAILKVVDEPGDAGVAQRAERGEYRRIKRLPELVMQRARKYLDRTGITEITQRLDSGDLDVQPVVPVTLIVLPDHPVLTSVSRERAQNVQPIGRPQPPQRANRRQLDLAYRIARQGSNDDSIVLWTRDFGE